MRKILWIGLMWALPVFAQSVPVDLRNAAGCGPVKEEYHAKVNKENHSLRQPDAGKAMVYVIVAEYPSPQSLTYLGNITTRVGMDGNWVGANYGESFAAFAVEPGERHICADWQSALKSKQRLSDALQLNAVAGKTYFYLVELWTGNSESAQQPAHEPALKLSEVEASRGMLLVSKTGESVWKKK